MKLTNNFSLAEFNSKDGSLAPAKVVENLKILSEQLEALRDYLGKPITVTSGYRSPQHNLKIGGALKSYHVLGMAADIKVKGITPKKVAEAIEFLIKEKKMLQGGIGTYRRWVHYDFRGRRMRW